MTRQGWQLPVTKLNLMLTTVGAGVALLAMYGANVATSQDVRNHVAQTAAQVEDHEKRLRGVEGVVNSVTTALQDIKDRLQRIERKLDGSK